MTELEKAELCARILSKKKAYDIKIIHTTDFTIIADYFVIVTGTSNTHVKSLADELEFQMEQRDMAPLHVEGRASGWILLDFGTVLVNVFTGESREYYNLERLWSDAETVPFDEEAE